MIRVVELFSGIGAQNAALRMSGLEYEIVAVSEIDEKAYKAYCALNDECPPNFGDITKVERLPKCDLVTFSAPCTDISNAGLKKGMEEGSGTRTSLIFEVARVIENTPERERPTYCLGENVPDIVNKKNLKHFMRFVQRMSNLGYSCRYSLLNAKDFGIPQNRKRCFMIFSRIGMTEFPKGWALDKCLEDVLEEKVDAKYYLSQKAIDGLIFRKKRQEANGNGFGFKPLTPKDIAHTITTGEGYRSNSSYILEIAKTSFDSDRVGQVGVIIIDGESYSIRHLTPRECFRLFGFTEEQIDRVFSLVIGKKNISNCTLYKIAGNSIVVPVLSEIFKTMYGKQSPTLFDF